MQPLDIPSSFNNSLLSWVISFTKNKALSLSTHNVTSKEKYSQYIAMLNHGPKNIDEVHEIIKLFSVINAKGIKAFVYPTIQMYKYLITLNLSSMRNIDTDIVLGFLTAETISKSDETKINYRNSVTNFFAYVSLNNEDVPGSNIGYQYRLHISRWQGLTGKSGKKLPAYLTEKEIYIFLDAVDNYSYSNEKYKSFYQLFIRILLYSGIRVSEAINIKMKNISFDSSVYSFIIDGKGNKQRSVHIEKHLIQEEMQLWQELASCTDGLLFCSARNTTKKASATSISIKISHILSSVGLNKRKSGAHLLRHSFGSFVYAKTKDQKLLQEQLGHSSSDTTAVYTHIADEEKRKISQLF